MSRRSSQLRAGGESEGLISPSASLRQSTEQLHRSVEAQIPWASYLSTVERYADLLSRLACLVTAADGAVEQQAAPDQPWLTRRRTAAALEADLRALAARGVTPSTLYEPVDFAWVASPAAAAGVLYVLEGSALGAAHLSRIAARDLTITPADGGSYLAGYGQQAARHWREVRDWLDRTLAAPADLDTAVDAARRTFLSYRTVLQSDERPIHADKWRH